MNLSRHKSFLTWALSLGGLLAVMACQNGHESNPSATPNADHVISTQTGATRCADTYAPVCGADGISYRNSCALNTLGKTTVASQGICPGKPVDPDGWTSSTGGNSGDTPVPPKDTLWCGTPDGPVEDPLDPPAGDKCSEPFPEGIAIKCASTLAPVCGCDGKTYRNDCYAMGVGHVWAKHEGACPGQPYVEE